MKIEARCLVKNYKTLYFGGEMSILDLGVAEMRGININKDCI